MTTEKASTPALIAAFAAVYIIWGSTYLAIKFAVETLPPFSMAGARFGLAGVILYAWSRSRPGTPAPTGEQWRTSIIVGGFMLFGGNGAVVWAEQYVASGLVALLVGTLPLWMVILDWLAGGERPTLFLMCGIAMGMFGIALLVGGEGVAGTSPLALAGGLVVITGSFLWAAGSIWSRGAPRPPSPLLGSGMQMIAGGAMLFVLGAVLGEWASFDPGSVSSRSLLALAYLTMFGSIVAFSAYVWLLRVTSAARVSTYAYVNPVVALILGWGLANEPITPRTLLAAGVILTSVMMIGMREMPWFTAAMRGFGRSNSRDTRAEGSS